MRVLVIEDTADYAWLLVKVLRLHGHEAESCSTGETGVARAIACKPELILLDNTLGAGITGVEVMARLKAGGFAGKTIMLTAFADPSVRTAAIAGGAHQFVVKSNVDFSRIGDLVSAALA